MSNHSAQFTTISVTPEVRDELRSRKCGGETYADLIQRMIAEYDSDIGDK